MTHLSIECLQNQVCPAKALQYFYLLWVFFADLGNFCTSNVFLLLRRWATFALIPNVNKTLMLQLFTHSLDWSFCTWNFYIWNSCIWNLNCVLSFTLTSLSDLVAACCAIDSLSTQRRLKVFIFKYFFYNPSTRCLIVPFIKIKASTFQTQGSGKEDRISVCATLLMFYPELLLNHTPTLSLPLSSPRPSSTTLHTPACDLPSVAWDIPAAMLSLVDHRIATRLAWQCIADSKIYQHIGSIWLGHQLLYLHPVHHWVQIYIQSQHKSV